MNLRSTLLLALVGAALSTSAQNLVRDPSFETVPLVDYTITGTVPQTFSLTGPSGTTYASDGFFFALLGFANGGTLSQTLPTLAGGTYRVEFDLSVIADPLPGTAPVSSFSATFGGRSILGLTDSASTGYARRSFLVTSVSGGDALAFSGSSDGRTSFALDNLSVQAVPEPSALAALGLGALGLLKRRKRA